MDPPTDYNLSRVPLPSQDPPIGRVADAPSRRVWTVAILLAIATMALFSRALEGGFILFDDPDYVTQNEIVRRGLTLDGVLTVLDPRTVVSGNWHPLTMISHMLDVQWFGLRPAGHHATSVVLHALSASLLFFWLTRMSGAIWPSALTAALFAWHPLRVESVAWIAERKDVLSMFFGMLTLLAYAHYVRRPGIGRYAGVAAMLALGLMSKPMLVTLPVVLLLLDWWPLGRLRFGRRSAARPKRDFGEAFRARPAAGYRPVMLVLEKVPLLLLSVAASAMTVAAQGGQGAIASLERIPLEVRLINGVWAYGAYLAKTCWPVRLAPFYPLYGETYAFEYGLAGLVALLLVSGLAVRLATSRPYIIVGWLWYVITLIPMLGIVQVGSARIADRYTYLPSIGLFMLVSWGLQQAVTSRRRAAAAVVASAGVLAILAALTWRQLGYWHDTVTLFEHAVEVTHDNYFAYNTLGTGLIARGDYAAALKPFGRAIDILPQYAASYYNRGVALAALGRYEQALCSFRQAREKGHPSGMCQMGIGMTLLELGRTDEAITALKQAIKEDPRSYETTVTLAKALARRGETGDAVRLFRRALELRPAASLPAAALARIHATSQDPRWRDAAQAVKWAQRAVQGSGAHSVLVLDTLAAAYAEAGRFGEAENVARRAAQLARQRDARGVDPARFSRLAADIERRTALYHRHQPLREPPDDFPW